jgi:hypothetical protein
VYEPLDFVAKLAALVPRPHKNLVVYHGVLAANAAWRSRVVAYGRQGGPVAGGEVEDVEAETPPHQASKEGRSSSGPFPRRVRPESRQETSSPTSISQVRSRAFTNSSSAERQSVWQS